MKLQQHLPHQTKIVNLYVGSRNVGLRDYLEKIHVLQVMDVYVHSKVKPLDCGKEPFL